MLAAPHRVIGEPDGARITLLRWLTFGAFALTGLWSVSQHLQDPLWRSGELGFQLLVGSYLSRLHDLWAEVFLGLPGLHEVSALATYGMIAWFALLPLAIVLRGTPSHLLAKYGSLGFFVFSLVCLNLGMLPVWELMLWVLWFWGSTSENGMLAARWRVLFDERRAAGARARRLMSRLDTTGKLEWRAMRDEPGALTRLGIDEGDRGPALVAVTERGAVLAGFRFYERVAVHVPTLFVVAPVLWLLGLTGLGPRLYRSLAGDDGLSAHPPRVPTPLGASERERRTGRRGHAAYVGTGMVTFAAVLAIYLAGQPWLPWGDTVWKARPSAVANTMGALGVGPINVFNEQDMRMSTHWRTLHVVGAGEDHLVPLTGADGDRLPLHLSDYVYFGHTLLWRRAMNDRDPSDTGCAAMVDLGDDLDFARLARRFGPGEGERIVMRYWYKPLPTREGLEAWREAEPELLCERSLGPFSASGSPPAVRSAR